MDVIIGHLIGNVNVCHLPLNVAIRSFRWFIRLMNKYLETNLQINTYCFIATSLSFQNQPKVQATTTSETEHNYLKEIENCTYL